MNVSSDLYEFDIIENGIEILNILVLPQLHPA